MTDREEFENFREMITELGLPRHDFALFGVRCPYCGKSDRIHQLERPAEVAGVPAEYARFWERSADGGELVLCKFCRQVLKYTESDHQAVPLVE